MIIILHHLDENGDNWSQTNKKTNFFQMRIADFRSFLRESANPFINLCSKFDNSIKLQQKKNRTTDSVQQERNSKPVI